MTRAQFDRLVELHGQLREISEHNFTLRALRQAFRNIVGRPPSPLEESGESLTQRREALLATLGRHCQDLAMGRPVQ